MGGPRIKCGPTGKLQTTGMPADVLGGGLSSIIADSCWREVRALLRPLRPYSECVISKKHGVR